LHKFLILMKAHNLKFSVFAKIPFCFSIILLAIVFFGAQKTAAQITITPVSWNVIGLDSNNVSDGPNVFPVGARICNSSGSALTNVTASFLWDSSNIYINLETGSPTTLTYSTIAAGACNDAYFNVSVTRTASAYNATRRFHITAVSGASTVSTPTPREIYVEKLVSQNRNSVNSISGPSTVYVGQTYQYTVNASTATNGYEQLEAFLSLSNVIFRVLAVSTTYSAPSAGTTNDKFYADGCGWDNNPSSANYRSCIGPANYSGGKAGGTVSTTYTVLVLSTGATTATTMIYDFSGSSYHYNSDYGIQVISITALPAATPNVELIKTVSPSGTQPPGTDLTYSISFTNSGTAVAQNFRLTDPNPATTIKLNTNTDFKVGSVVNSLGTTGLTIAVSYSNDNGSTFAYTPVSGSGGAPAGYDANVTHVRWTFTGTLSQTSPNNTGTISFIERIR
jgi:uncharacterized repeat protein (TIGR01451 family)